VGERGLDMDAAFVDRVYKDVVDFAFLVDEKQIVSRQDVNRSLGGQESTVVNKSIGGVGVVCKRFESCLDLRKVCIRRDIKNQVTRAREADIYDGCEFLKSVAKSNQNKLSNDVLQVGCWGIVSTRGLEKGTYQVNRVFKLSALLHNRLDIGALFDNVVALFAFHIRLYTIYF
jgi:hypothetical protein